MAAKRRGLAFDDRLVEERFVRSAGPGGQNVNKVATAVELRVRVGALPIGPDARDRLRALAGQRLTDDDVLVLHAREYRTQGQNREAARARLAEMLRQASVKPRRRRPTRPGKAAVERRITSKRRRGETKRSRRSNADD